MRLTCCTPRRSWTRFGPESSVQPGLAGRWDKSGGNSLKLLRCVMDLEELIGQELNMEAFTVDMSANEMLGPSRWEVERTGSRRCRMSSLIS